MIYFFELKLHLKCRTALKIIRMNAKDLLDLVIRETYGTKTDMSRLFGLTGKPLNAAYANGLAKDQKELAGRLIYPDGKKIRITSMCWATGTNLNDLIKRLKAAA